MFLSYTDESFRIDVECSLYAECRLRYVCQQSKSCSSCNVLAAWFQEWKRKCICSVPTEVLWWIKGWPIWQSARGFVWSVSICFKTKLSNKSYIFPFFFIDQLIGTVFWMLQSIWRMERLEFKDLFMREQDVSTDEKLFMGYLQILWNQLTVSKLTLIFFSNYKKMSFSKIQLIVSFYWQP